MGMSTSVYGFRPPDEAWKKMKAVWDACEAAGTEIPNEVSNFFNDEEPDDAGVEVDLGEALREYADESRQGYEVDVKKLPKGLTTIRFVNSW